MRHNPGCFRDVLQKVQGRLMETFGDLVQVMRSTTLQAQILQLPFAAVLALLRR